MTEQLPVSTDGGRTWSSPAVCHCETIYVRGMLSAYRFTAETPADDALFESMAYGRTVAVKARRLSDDPLVGRLSRDGTRWRLDVS